MLFWLLLLRLLLLGCIDSVLELTDKVPNKLEILRIVEEFQLHECLVLGMNGLVKLAGHVVD